MDADYRDEFRKVTSSIDYLTQGLTLVVETLGILSEQIQKIHEATTAERPPSDLAEALNNFSMKMEGFVSAIEHHGERLDRIGDVMAGLPTVIEEATKRGAVRALDDVMSDTPANDATAT